MIHDMPLQRLAPRTQAASIAAVAGLAKCSGCSPDQRSPDQMRSSRHHFLVERRLAWRSCAQVACGRTCFLYHDLSSVRLQQALGGVAGWAAWQGWPVRHHALAQHGTPTGQMTWAMHITLAPTWFDPAETGALQTPYMCLRAYHLKNPWLKAHL